MSILYKSKGNQFRAPEPRAWLKAALLTDDIFHYGLNRAAEKIEDRLHCGRKPIAITALGLGCAAGCFFVGRKYGINSVYIKVLIDTIFILRPELQKPKEFFEPLKSVDGSEFICKDNLSLIRLPSLAVGALLSLLPSQSALFENVGAYSMGFGVFAYLISSSNGMLDRAKDAVSSFIGKVALVFSGKTALVPVARCSQEGSER